MESTGRERVKGEGQEGSRKIGDGKDIYKKGIVSEIEALSHWWLGLLVLTVDFYHRMVKWSCRPWAKY